MKTFGIIILIALLPLLPSAAQTPENSPYWRIIPHSYCCLRASAPIVVDGKADDADWHRAPWTADFVDIEGAGRPAPRFRTRVKMLWDETFFYVFAELEEPHVWARLLQRDTVIFHDNDFEIFVCPTGTNHTYYEYEVNAYNTVWDLFLLKPYRDGGPADNGWDIRGLRSAVFVHGTLNDPTDIDEGWSVEVAIPWAAFDRTAIRVDGTSRPVPPAPPVTGTSMRVNFSRVQWRHDAASGSYRKPAGQKEDNWVWSPQGVIDMHRPEKWGWVYFLDQAAACGAVRPEPRYDSHMALFRLYEAQKAHVRKHKHYAATLDELVLPSPIQALLGKARLDLRARGPQFTARCVIEHPDGSELHLTIDERSHLLTRKITP